MIVFLLQVVCQEKKKLTGENCIADEPVQIVRERVLVFFLLIRKLTFSSRAAYSSVDVL